MKSRLLAALTHLAFSTLIAVLVGLLVFGVWYRQPFGELLGGHELFLWVIFVDVTLGPLLTFVVFNTAKPRAALVRDIGMIVLLQLLALTYGLYVMSLGRPVWVAQEGDRFRVVRRADIDMKTIGEAPATLQSFSWTGPEWLAARLSKATDPDYVKSIQRSIEGDHPSFRPGRWLPYGEQKMEGLKNALPLAQLIQKKPALAASIEQYLQQNKLDQERLMYMPLIAGDINDWIVLLDRHTAEPVGFLHVDGWIE